MNHLEISGSDYFRAKAHSLFGLFQDLKVKVNRWYDYMFIRRVFIVAIYDLIDL